MNTADWRTSSGFLPAAPGLYARVAGFAYLMIFALAIFANFFVFEGLAAPGDASTTAANMMREEQMFRIGIACFIAVLIFDVIVGWALFVILRPTAPNHALLAMVLRLVYTTAHVGVVLYLVGALQLTAGGGVAYSAFAPAERAALAYRGLVGHNQGFAITLIFFGVHLLTLGPLLIRAPYLPSFIGILIVLAGAGYVIDGFGGILFADYGGRIASLVAMVPALVGEGALTLWLLIMGVNKRRWDSAFDL
ncbi:MAG: DUF4386 family protein [Alphaproteobacteria bacterium]|nr:DUF4386 family protein [Alphaproteobacteria bacterium]